VNRPESNQHIAGETETARIVNARLDQHGKHAADSDLGDFNNPSLYHVAMRISREKGKSK
jgi:hypothetical protein